MQMMALILTRGWGHLPPPPQPRGVNVTNFDGVNKGAIRILLAVFIIVVLINLVFDLVAIIFVGNGCFGVINL